LNQLSAALAGQPITLKKVEDDKVNTGRGYLNYILAPVLVLLLIVMWFGLNAYMSPSKLIPRSPRAKKQKKKKKPQAKKKATRAMHSPKTSKKASKKGSKRSKKDQLKKTTTS
jgi:hypothetical protein